MPFKTFIDYYSMITMYEKTEWFNTDSTRVDTYTLEELKSLPDASYLYVTSFYEDAIIYRPVSKQVEKRYITMHDLKRILSPAHIKYGMSILMNVYGHKRVEALTFPLTREVAFSRVHAFSNKYIILDRE